MELEQKTELREVTFTNKALITLIVPLVIEQFLNVAVGLADSLMVASVGEAAVSAVSLVDSVNVLLIFALNALATGGAVVCGQFLGRRENCAVQKMQPSSCWYSSHCWQWELLQCSTPANIWCSMSSSGRLKRMS